MTACLGMTIVRIERIREALEFIMKVPSCNNDLMAETWKNESDACLHNPQVTVEDLSIWPA